MIYTVLHNIRSLYNVGSIFRTADAAGVEKLYLCGITGTPPRKEITKVALGAEQTVPWEYVRRTSDVVKRLKKQGVRVVALEKTRKSIDYRDFDPVIASGAKSRSHGDRGSSMPTPSSILDKVGTESGQSPGDRHGLRPRDDVSLALLVGNEVEGLPPVLLKLADVTIHIPMRGKKESLNVSVAFGIAVYVLLP